MINRPKLGINQQHLGDRLLTSFWARAQTGVTVNNDWHIEITARVNAIQQMNSTDLANMPAN